MSAIEIVISREVREVPSPDGWARYEFIGPIRTVITIESEPR